MIATVIVDNTASGGLAGEWGLCILVEQAGKKILLDTGASDLFVKNMRQLGFDISDIDYAVLSHAHYDHANGIPTFFRLNQKAKFYFRESAQEDCYGKRFIFQKYIGIPKGLMTRYADRIEAVSGDYELMKGAYLIPHKTADLEAIGKREGMLRRTSDGWKPDDFSHEQSLVLDTEKGLVILNSCSHGGVVNIIREVGRTFPDKHVYGIIGGFHLFNKSAAEVRDEARRIRETGIDFVCTGHCTKERAYAILKEELGDRLSQLSVGLQMKF